MADYLSYLNVSYLSFMVSINAVKETSKEKKMNALTSLK